MKFRASVRVRAKYNYTNLVSRSLTSSDVERELRKGGIMEPIGGRVGVVTPSPYKLLFCCC